jgi:DNA-binding PadR family transcriptional regulator
MENRIVRKLFLGFISIHILHHAQKEPVYGSWMIDELRCHGYAMSAGTLYPILHSLQRDGLLHSEDRNVDGKIRKYYAITDSGTSVLKQARERAFELFKNIKSAGDLS